jgi:hypothetical protein
MASARMSVKFESAVGSNFELPRRVEKYGEDSESDKQLTTFQGEHSRVTALANSITGMLHIHDENE